MEELREEIRNLRRSKTETFIEEQAQQLLKLKKVFGTESRIQLNDQFATDIKEVREFVELGRSQRDESEKKLITISLKVNKDTRMGIVTDVKQELREVGAFKINYSTAKRAIAKK